MESDEININWLTMFLHHNNQTHETDDDKQKSRHVVQLVSYIFSVQCVGWLFVCYFYVPLLLRWGLLAEWNWLGLESGSLFSFLCTDPTMTFDHEFAKCLFREASERMFLANRFDLALRYNLNIFWGGNFCFHTNTRIHKPTYRTMDFADHAFARYCVNGARFW